jgi:DNA-binding CsgD family transcriptional regulator
MTVDELSPGGLGIVVEVAGIASAPGSVEERAAALLESLRRVLAFQGAWIGVLDPERGGHLPLAVTGYDERVRAVLDGPEVVADIELLGMNAAQPPMRLRDLPVPPEELRAWAEYLRPAGFRNGLAVGLCTPDGRHLGVLAMHTETPDDATDAARGLLDLLSPMIATAVDPMRTISAMARIVHRASAGTVLTRAGTTLPLPGLPPHPVLTAGSAVLTVAARTLSDRGTHAVFLAPYAETPDDSGYVRVTVLGTAAEAPSYLVAAVVVSPPGDLRGLTRRELQVLGLLVEGWSNARIAAGLLLAERTVATYVEHILVKLAAPTRTLAAVRALRHGLYLPLAHGGT